MCLQITNGKKRLHVELFVCWSIYFPHMHSLKQFRLQYSITAINKCLYDFS